MGDEPGENHEIGMELNAKVRLPTALGQVFDIAGERIGWPVTALMDTWATYAWSYKEAAHQLADDISAGVARADHLWMPLVFLYRHYLELSLKQLILAACDCQETEAPGWLSKTHDVNRLWEELRPRLADTVGDGGDEYDAIARRLEELGSLDPGSYAFRYPSDRDGAPSLPRVNVDLHQLKDSIQVMADAFDALGTALYEYRLALSEAYEANSDNPDA